MGSFSKRHVVTPPEAGLPLLVGRWFQVLFHSPHRGTFHLSLTVLVHYRQREYLALGLVRPRFLPDFSCPTVLGIPTDLVAGFRVRGYHPLWRLFPEHFPYPRLNRNVGPTTPSRRFKESTAGFRLFPVRSPLLGESLLISFPPATWMFPFAGFPPPAKGGRCPTLTAGRVSPFGNPRIIACLAAPRGLSQPTAPFIGSRYQGIHHLPYALP